MDYMQASGCLSLGSRLKRLSDKIYKDVAHIYQEQNIDLHPTYFPLLNLLHQQGPLSVTQAAEILNVSHPAISKIAHKMQAEKLIYKTLDPNDERRFFLALDQKSLTLLTKIEPIMVNMRAYLDSLINAQKHPLLESLTEFEQAYNKQGLINPVLNSLASTIHAQQVAIISWQEDYHEDFYRLNMAWLTQYFSSEINDLDRQALNTPQSYYLARGGYIWLAKLNQEIIGCIALACYDDGVYEISKMGVDENYQGFGVGRKLLLTALNKARELDAKRIYLETSSLLPRALTLYQHMGFSITAHPNGQSNYLRSDIYMELTI